MSWNATEEERKRLAEEFSKLRERLGAGIEPECVACKMGLVCKNHPKQRTKMEEQYKNLEFIEIPDLEELRVYGHGDSGYLRFMGESADLVRTMRDILTAKVDAKAGQAEQGLREALLAIKERRSPAKHGHPDRTMTCACALCASKLAEAALKEQL